MASFLWFSMRALTGSGWRAGCLVGAPRTIAALGWVVAGCTSPPAAPPQPELSTVAWPVDNVSKVGGYPATPIGEPALVQDEAGGELCFDGKKDALIVDINPLDGQTAFTVEALFKPAAGGAMKQQIVHLEDGQENRVILETRADGKGHWFLHSFVRTPLGNQNLEVPARLHDADAWYWISLTYGAGAVKHFVNGVEEASLSLDLQPMQRGQMAIGSRISKENWFRGCVREVRFANGALPVSRLGRL